MMGTYRSISTHAPRAGSDRYHEALIFIPRKFQPTLPVRGATGFKKHYPLFFIFQPTLPVRGATRGQHFVSDPPFISTHAPRAGSDGGDH